MASTKSAPNWDLRTDTATKPSPEMFQHMAQAEVGNDVFGEDPTVNKLEKRVAELLGKPAAVFVASSTMSNQIAVRTHLRNPPETVLCHSHAHIYRHEAGGISFHSQAMVVPVTPANGPNLTVDDVKREFIEDDGDFHCAPTRLIALENTFTGVVMPIEDIREIRKFANEKGIPVHMDGARLWNASVASGLSLADYAKEVDSVNLCLSKGMGCPVGAILAGSEEFIQKARHYRKLFGGGWRQAGVLAAAGLFSIDHIWPTMAKTHEQTKRLADGLSELGFKPILPVETNIILIDPSEAKVDWGELTKQLAKHGVNMDTVYGGTIRIVLHNQIDDACVDLVLSVAKGMTEN
ncbi:Threonine aldolase [Linderina macrospora]|uniref:Threonine aldolase n=1 Tax=Linderina macrospora TaxID=4868 RepID=A0ACC1JHE0_9FUNG|nr:Threonine aldolase [Linderina macrospora]